MPSPLTAEDRFKLCFKSLPDIADKNSDLVISKFHFNKDELNRLLIKTDLEPYSEVLWKFGLQETYIKHYQIFSNIILFDEYNSLSDNNSRKSFTDYMAYISKYKPEFVTIDKDGLSSIDTSSKEKKADNLELTNLLIFLLEENENGINVNFKSNLLNKSFNTKSNFLLKSIIDVLKNEYVTRKLNEVNLTDEEAELELLAAEDRYWVRDYMSRFSNIHYIHEGGCFYFEEYDIYTDEDNIQEYITTDMIEDYADEHYKFADITIELLKEKQIELSSKLKKKVGAKAKNDNIANISERLSYLIRLNRFIKQDKCNDISEYPLSNKDCRLIHDYLTFYDLIPDQNSKTTTTTTPENYIKALIKNYRTHRLKHIQERTHFHINSYKNNNNFPFFQVE